MAYFDVWRSDNAVLAINVDERYPEPTRDPLPYGIHSVAGCEKRLSGRRVVWQGVPKQRVVSQHKHHFAARCMQIAYLQDVPILRHTENLPSNSGEV